MSEWATLDGTTLRFERRFKHPPEKVWRAITDPSELAHWFPARVEGERKPGAPLRFVFDADTPMPELEHTGQITAFEPPRRFAFSWNDDVLTFEMHPDGAGCHLVFTHVVSESNGGWLAAGRDAAGWDTCLESLSARLDGVQPSAPDMLELMESYADRFGLATGTVQDTDGGKTLRFERDLVWKPLAQAWQLLVDGAGYLEPGAPAPAGATPPGLAEPGAITHVEPPTTLELTADGVIRWQFSADPRLGHRVLLTHAVPADADVDELLAAWQAHLQRFFAQLVG
jgi:uncharacterized protein YndB with AHSA1/START domain